jgi:glycosyltransferase involved in cell wall biosynthesis
VHGGRRILIVSDAWTPQVNGVVRTLATVAGELRAMGHVVEVVGPDRFRTVACPTYPEIRLALAPRRRLARLIAGFAPDHLHIATEGPLGWSARAWARRHRAAFTTSFHTKFAEYLHARTRVPVAWTYAWLRRFHAPSSAVLAATPSLRAELEWRGFANVRAWTRGVDLALFRPHRDEDGPREDVSLPRPVFLYVGRVAVEKNIRAFLDLDLPGSKVVVGDGPQLAALRREYPRAQFLGARFGEALARAYAGADAFVFPSLTDTFGLVMLEALACGTPVAAFPVTGPLDVLGAAPGAIGAIDTDLRRAALASLEGDRAACRAHAERYSWRACAEAFLGALIGLHADAVTPREATLERRVPKAP